MTYADGAGELTAKLLKLGIMAFSEETKAAAYRRAGGKCEVCDETLRPQRPVQ